MPNSSEAIPASVKHFELILQKSSSFHLRLVVTRESEDTTTIMANIFGVEVTVDRELLELVVKFAILFILLGFVYTLVKTMDVSLER